MEELKRYGFIYLEGGLWERDVLLWRDCCERLPAGEGREKGDAGERVLYNGGDRHHPVERRPHVPGECGPASGRNSYFWLLGGTV